MLRVARPALVPLVPAGAAACAVVALAACSPRPAPRTPTVGKGFVGCLPLTGTSRASLRLGPHGDYLYWTEQVRMHGFEEAWPSIEVVRWPVVGGPVERLTDAIDNPYRVLGDGRVVGIRENKMVGVWGPSGSELVSYQGSIDHLELLASDQAVVYHEGESIWRQPVTRQAAHWLAYADSLLGVDGNAVYVRNKNDSGDHLVRVDAETGVSTELPWLDNVTKAVPGAFVIQNDLGIGTRAPDGGPIQSVLTGNDWQIKVGPEAVKAWRKVGPRLDGAIVTASGADKLPSVLGGDSLEGFVRLPDGRVAYLVGHDLDGDDEVTTGDEVDVCLGRGDSKEVKIEPRSTPARWRQAGDKVAALIKDRLGGGTWHFEAGDKVPGLYIETPATRADLPAIWADIRAIATTVTAATGDPTLFIDVTYGDQKRGFSEWWAGTGRRVAWAGTGGATVPDVADYDALITTSKLRDIEAGDEDTDEDDEDDGDGATMAICTGTVTNNSDHVLRELVADCVSGTDDSAIDVLPADLAPGQVGHFDAPVRHTSGSNLAVSVHSGNGRDEVPGFATDRHLRYVGLQKLAAQVLDRTRLVYRDTAGSDPISVHVAAPPGFGTWSGQAREQAASVAHELFARQGAILGGDDGATVTLRITADDQTWTYEEGHLSGGGD